MHPWSVLGAKSRPGRCRGGPPSITGLHHLEPPGPKMWFKCVLLDARGFKMAPKLHLFSIGWYLDAPKMLSEREVGQKHEKIMKHRCEILMFSLAQNHVWRYTLCIFHTFAGFRICLKICAFSTSPHLMKPDCLPAPGLPHCFVQAWHVACVLLVDLGSWSDWPVVFDSESIFLAKFDLFSYLI